MGQILSDEGSQDQAINCLIDALRWDSKNHWALLMMGNIQAKFLKDVPTALKYYEQALLVNPSDYVTLSNVAYLLLQDNQLQEAKNYLTKALAIKDDYPNSHFVLSLLSIQENKYEAAFEATISALKCNPNRDQLYKDAVKQAFYIAKEIVGNTNATALVTEFKNRLEQEGGTPIEIQEDDQITTPAKIEFAENYHRSFHQVRFKPNYPAVEHLILHEFTHLDFVIQARKLGKNKLVTATPQHKATFLASIQASFEKLKNRGVPESQLTLFGNGLFDGLNLQAYNMPIDLFIEDFLYHDFPALRPFQFLSLYTMLEDGLKSCTDAHVQDISPPKILSITKIFNLLNAMQFQRLFGMDYLPDFKATAAEMRKAEELNLEFLEYKDNRKPAQEYELVQHWAEDLQIDAFFELEDEIPFRKSQDIDSFITQLQDDPFGIDQPEDPTETLAMAQFQEEQEAIGTNMAVVMFMVEALQYFKDLPVENIKKIAFEIAMIGQQGIDTKIDNYIVGSFPDKRFSGYQLLAYYYVSWALAVPEHVGELGLNFVREFELATKMASG